MGRLALTTLGFAGTSLVLGGVFWWTSGLAAVAARRAVRCPVPGEGSATIATPTDHANLRLDGGDLRGSARPEVAVCVETADALWVLSPTGCEWVRLPTSERRVLVPADRAGHGVRVRGPCGAWRVPPDGTVRVPRDWTEVEVDLSSGRSVHTVAASFSVDGVLDVSREEWPAELPVDPDHVAATERDERDGLLPVGWTVDNLTHAW